VPRKLLIFGTGILGLTVLVALIFLAVRTAGSPIGFALARADHPGSTEALFRASITNKISKPIHLNASVAVTYEAAGDGGASDFVRLAGSGTSIGSLLPQASDSVELRAPDSVTQVRVCFTYTYPADPVRTALWTGLNTLGFRPRPQSAVWSWLGRNGLLGGKFMRTYDETWFVETNSIHR
jgi:hypothetical protein